jgi:hypothetical protein
VPSEKVKVRVRVPVPKQKKVRYRVRRFIAHWGFRLLMVIAETIAVGLHWRRGVGRVNMSVHDCSFAAS